MIAKPGDTPFLNLAREWTRAFQPLPEQADAAALDLFEVDVQFTSAPLRGGQKGLVRAFQNEAFGPDATVLVDQFEELFRFRRPQDGSTSTDPTRTEAQQDEAAAFVDLLLGTARQTEVPIYVVLTMRSDFLGDCDAFLGLPEQISRSQDLTPRLWDVATGKPRDEPLRQEGFVYLAAFSPDGNTLATASDDKTARRWDVATGKPCGEPLRLESSVHPVAFSPDGSTLATACADKTARLWDVATGQPRGEPLQHSGSLNSVAFSPDGSKLATTDGTAARLWDVPPPAADEPERLWLSIEVRTWHTFEDGLIRPLTHDEWRARKAKLDALGGPCDVRRWRDLSEKERAELRSPSPVRRGS